MSTAFSGVVKLLNELTEQTTASDTDVTLIGTTSPKKITFANLKKALGINTISTTISNLSDRVDGISRSVANVVFEGMLYSGGVGKATLPTSQPISKGKNIKCALLISDTILNTTETTLNLFISGKSLRCAYRDERALYYVDIAHIDDTHFAVTANDDAISLGLVFALYLS